MGELEALEYAFLDQVFGSFIVLVNGLSELRQGFPVVVEALNPTNIRH